MKKPETKFKEKVQRDLKALGRNVWFVKIQQVSIRGIPDILACVCGVFVALELKVQNGEVDLLQAKSILDINDAQGKAYIVTPESWPTVLREIETIINQVNFYINKVKKPKQIN